MQSSHVCFAFGTGFGHLFVSGIERRKSFAGVMDWQGWAITLGCPYSDGTGERGPGKYDGKFDAAPDIDHGNKKVQQSIQRLGFEWGRLRQMVTMSGPLLKHSTGILYTQCGCHPENE